MAFSGRFGNLCKKSISHNVLRCSNVPMMPMLDAIRQMSSTVFIGGLPWDVNDQTLIDAFTKYGDLTSAKVFMSRKHTKGFGCVTYASIAHARAAISAMDGKELNGRVVNVRFFKDNPIG